MAIKFDVKPAEDVEAQDEPSANTDAEPADPTGIGTGSSSNEASADNASSEEKKN